MAKKKNNFYAVKRGVCPGIYDSWEKCKAQVDGFSGALYKGFATKKEAETYLASNSPENQCVEPHEVAIYEPKTDITIYVDGSFDENTGVYGYGYVVLFDDGTVKKFYGAGNNKEPAMLRNVAGEMLAAMHAVKFAIKNNCKSVLICYDYSGIECWATGEWKAKNSLTSKYARAMQGWKKEIDIHFQKVAAHTGVEFNEMVDQLAKYAVNTFNR